MTSLSKSRRSGGPRTAEGKIAASQNSLKTGAYSNQEVLPGENLQELLELEQFFIEDFSPKGVTESALVHDLTVLAWKKLRLERLEYRRLRDKLNEPLDYFEAESIGFSIPTQAQSYFDDPSLIAECDLSLASEQLKHSKKLKSAKFVITALEQMHAESLSTFLKIKRKIEDLGATVSTAKNMVDCKYSDSTETTPLQDVTNNVIAECEAIVWALKHYDQILLAKQKVRDKRLVSALGFEKGRRAGDDLDRFFFRTLGELRKQQEWRYRRDAIVMAEQAPPVLEDQKAK
ncbi:hypothetical protein [Polynucleobacter sphagniphilus]|uniref:hypothetical protein n=1 Tax=Polynucleobacter sphagniphilus TaxID=1743169 RepID=UPI0024770597|nr:hypothetical protein [Polynucleobacter sphagniphilus]MDH6525519.1 hypothetical protein [Polynucleobacter sphagniphilus]